MTEAKKHIIVTDDENHTLLALSLILKKGGFKVTAVSSGEAALAAVEATVRHHVSLDLLVIDFQMPGITGIEVIERMARLALSVPILIISGYEAKGILAERLCSGSIWFLKKPFEPHVFLDCVHTAIARAEQVQRCWAED